MNSVYLLLLGLIAGIASGVLGIGGGIIIIPALVLLLGMSQHMAQGTTLAMMVPPIGLLAAWAYYKSGNVNLQAAAIMCITFFIGGLIGAKFSNSISGTALTRIFGVAMFLISLKMIFTK